MPLNKEPLRLEADPKSVHQARQWVTTLLHELDRHDLLECAELGISELVTNALLHADDPITVRMRGTREHPRLEVTDGSRNPPVLPGPAASLDDLLATFGRGLDIVSRCSIAWGATIERDGKVMWFEPADHPREEEAAEGRLIDQVRDDSAAPTPEGERVAVRLLGLPVVTALGLRRQYRDLRRELRLLSLAHGDDYPLAGDLTNLFVRFEGAYPAELLESVDRAAADGVDVVDVDATIPTGATEVFQQMLELMDLADEFCRSQRLLSLARSPHQREFQRWLLGEFIHQADGAAPTGWRHRTDDATAAKHVS